MKTLIENATLILPGHPDNGKQVTFLTDGKKLISTKGKAKDAKKAIDARGMYVFPRFVDAQAHSGEPGFEDKEDFDSLTRAAAAGGFSDVFILPSTDPVIDSKSEVNFIHKASGTNGVKLHALGAVTKELHGEELSEMYDMHLAGVRAFSDGKVPLHDVNMMKRALYYAKNFGGIVCSFPHDERIAPGGMVNESPANTLLGLKATPSLAEELMLNRDLYLLRYADSRLHVSTITTAGSVSLIAKAKKEKLDVSCGVALANLCFTEAQLADFDTRYKTTPPLRAETDRKALIKGLNSGVIDVIVTDHTPEVVEHKDIEFDQAAPGMIMLETVLPAYFTYLANDLSLETFVKSISLRPRERFGLDMPTWQDGARFDFFVYDPSAEWVYDHRTTHSKAQNSPFWKQPVTGRVVPI